MLACFPRSRAGPTGRARKAGSAGGISLSRSGKFMNFNIYKNAVLDFLFPIYCVFCQKEKAHCCEQCFSKIPLDSAGSADGIFAAAIHRENSPLAKLIHRFKYDGAKEIGELLALLTEKIVKRNANLLQNALLVPVPLHWRRKNQRGFNQSEILASEIGKMHGFEVKNILARHRFTRPQVELHRMERLKNPVGAFSLKDAADFDPSRTWILIDDVATTGSTIQECTKTLKQHGAERVHSVVVARAM